MHDLAERPLDRLLLWMGASALALVLLTVFSAVWMQRSVEPTRPTSRQVTAPSSEPSLVADDEGGMSRPHLLRRFALNAFLAPLMDDAVPVRWSDAALDFMCDDQTRVYIDGKPLVSGSPVPTVPFAVRWDMNHCEPLGPAMSVSGGVDLFISRDASGMTAVVVPDRLRILGLQGQTHINRAFTATLSLASASTHP